MGYSLADLFVRLFRKRKLRTVALGVIVLFVITFGSSVVLWHLEQDSHLTFMDSLWMTVVTMTTVGYGDIYPKTFAGRLFTIFVPMICGIGAMAYLISLLSASIIRRGVGLVAVNDELKVKFKNHVLIVNCPTEGKVLTLLDTLQSEQKFEKCSFVLITDDVDACPELLAKRKNFYFIKGNPALVHVLDRANASHASAAILLARDPRNINSDGLTIQVALMLEQMHRNVGKEITTVAEVISPDSIAPLQVAGVEVIVCLETVVPPLLAEALLRESMSTSLEQETG